MRAAPSRHPILAPAALLAAASVLVLLLAPASTLAAADYTHARGLGPVKAAGKGLLRVKLKDGSTVLTHGLDQKPPHSADQTLDSPGPERQPACATDHRINVLYGHAAGTPNRLAQVGPVILAEVKRVNALLNENALASGGHTADLKVGCDGAGEIRVDSFQSSEAGAQTTFAGVVNAARTAGFAEPNVDYAVFFDSAAPPACGTGTYSPDERLVSDNANNSGGDYAVVYSDCWEDRTALHEIAHNQGAVQYNAPYSTGSGAHCNDGYDLMCYSDGGDRDVGMSVICADRLHFDCRYDSYFDTAPEPGEYLASHWNLGSPLNRFIALDGAGASKPACSDGLDNDGDGRRDFGADLGCTASGDSDETDLPACLDLRDNDGDGRTDFPGDPGCSFVLDKSEDDGDEVRSTAIEGDSGEVLPTLTMATARRHARKRIKRRHRRAAKIRARCSRRTRTAATCRLRWRVPPRASYSARMVVRYRIKDGEVALASTSRVRRVR